VCTKLLTTLKDVQQGKIADQWGWLDTVQEPQEYETEAYGNGVKGH
jgi:hypothetical protein